MYRLCAVIECVCAGVYVQISKTRMLIVLVCMKTMLNLFSSPTALHTHDVFAVSMRVQFDKENCNGDCLLSWG